VTASAHTAHLYVIGMSGKGKSKLRAGGWPYKAAEGYLNKEHLIKSGKYERWVELDSNLGRSLREAWGLLLTGRYTLVQICEELYRSQIKQVTHNDRDTKLSELNWRISQLRGEELRLGRLFISGKLSEEAYDRLRLEWQKLRHGEADLADLERDTAMHLDDLDVALVLLSGLSRLYDRLREKERHTLLQIVAKRVIIGTDGETIDHELHSPFAYLRNVVDDFSNADKECGSGQIRLGSTLDFVFSPAGEAMVQAQRTASPVEWLFAPN
jgi:hypothetical protein